MSDPGQTDAAGDRTVGLLAGSGLFPICFARAARARGVRVVAVALKGEADPALAQHADEIHWTGLARLGQWIKLFKRAGVRHAVMCGAITKSTMYRNIAGLMPDLRSAKFWYSKLRSREDHTVLEALAEEFESEGIHIESSVLYCPDLLAPAGCLTRRQPTDREWADVCFGWPLIKQIAEMQIGQTIVVKDRAVIAVEGMDGTDAALRRGGGIGRGDVVAIKVAKDGHDPRFDIPCVGPDTVDVLRESGVSLLATEAGNTILLEREETVRKADAAKVAILALTASDILTVPPGSPHPP